MTIKAQLIQICDIAKAELEGSLHHYLLILGMEKDLLSMIWGSSLRKSLKKANETYGKRKKKTKIRA